MSKEYNKKYYQLHKVEICKKKNKGIRNDRILLSGEIFHNLTVIELCEKDKNGKICYLCRCKCGTIKAVRRSYLLNGRTKSCGCGRSVANSINGKKHIHLAIAARKQFVGDISGALWSKIINNAKIRNISVDISKEYAWKLFLKQNKKCALTGLELYLNPRHVNRTNVNASLDRINSSDGYVEGNVQWIHKDVNKMKNNFPEVRYKQICKLVFEYDIKSIK